MRKITILYLLITIILNLNAQNAIVGSGFSSGWGSGCGSNSNFTYFGASAGTSYISGDLTPNGTGNQYWRLGVDWGGTLGQYNNGGSSDVSVTPGTKYNLNMTCTGSGAMYRNVSSTSNRYIFKTLNTGSSPTGTWVFFELGGTRSSVLSVAQSPLSSTVVSGQSVIVTATLSSSFPSGQGAYLRYTTDNFSTSTVTAMSGSGTSFTATIPSLTNTSGANIKYYIFTSGTGLTITSSDADLYTINLNNNTGSNYSYTVIAPTASTDYFRSSSTGNWSDIASWQSSANNSTWISSTLVPGSSATAITILNGHSITLNQDATISNLTTNSGGTFTASDATARTLTISKSTTGTATTLSNSGTWANGSGGSTVVFTGTPSSGDAIHAISGTIGFQNVSVNKTSGTSNVGASFGAASSLTGTLEIGAGGFISTAPPTSFYGSNAILKFNQGSGATYDVNAGDYSWSTTVIPNYITISSGTVNLNANRTATGDLLIDGGALVLNSNNPNLTIQGNWVRTSGTFTANNGTVTLSGGNNTPINVAGSANMNSLIISKTSGAIVTLESPLVTNSLSISSGAQLTVIPGKQVTVNTTFTNNGTLNLKSDNTGAVATILTPTTISGSGTYNIEQYLTAGRNWYISSPISGATSNVFSASVSYPMYSYNEPQGTNAPWTTISNTSTTLTDAKGYIAKIQADGNVTFTGTTLNNDSKSIALTRTAGQTKEGFNLVGNPYPSHLAWTEATATAANVLPTIWYRTATYNSGASKYDYSFVTYNAPSGLTIPDVGSGGYIPPMQAFWVRTNTVAGGTLSLTNALRYHQASNPLKAPAKQNTGQQILRLKVSNGIDSDETVVYFNPNASNDFDDYDSPKMQNDAAIPDIYTFAGSEKLAINGLNSIPLDQEIPIGFRTNALHDFTLNSSELSNFDSNIKVILKDNGVENDITDGTAYNFSSAATTTSSRFSLIFRSAGTTTNLSDPELNKDFVVYKNADNQISVLINEKTNQSYNISVYNSCGQKLEEVVTAASKTILSKVLSTGVYFVAINGSGKNITRKLVLY